MNKQHGFTLIELSIVIIIMGLLISGIAAGSTLLEQAKITRVIREFYNLNIALNTFSMQYKALPGDFDNASSFWSSSNCAAGPVTAGCNGNANGDIDVDSFVPGGEIFRAFQHLSLAGLINGNYDGTNRFYMDSAYPPGVYTIRIGTDFGVNKNKIELGANIPNFYSCNSVLTVTSAHFIDQKIDDGVANTGALHGLDGCDAIPFSCSAPFTVIGGADYNLASTGTTCRLFYYFPLNNH